MVENSGVSLCKSRYPKRFSDATVLGENSYPTYKRRDNSSIGPELTREYRKKLYSNLGLFCHYGHEELAIYEDIDQGARPPVQEYEQKEPVDEYEKGERLDLEDNDPEYETEEYGDMVEEEVEDVNEDLESEEDDDHVGEEHGQMVDEAEEDEHDEVVKERRKRKELEIFIGGLDKDATEDDLRKVLSEVGDVTEVRFMMNPQTMKNKGFAFLRFTTVEQASL
nr:heterogeneous nuclear ribonucleoprotein R-like isoform X1 [Ipomoea batatas]